MCIVIYIKTSQAASPTMKVTVRYTGDCPSRSSCEMKIDIKRVRRSKVWAIVNLVQE
jgi:hypothetical protein